MLFQEHVLEKSQCILKIRRPTLQCLKPVKGCSKPTKVLKTYIAHALYNAENAYGHFKESAGPQIFVICLQDVFLKLGHFHK